MRLPCTEKIIATFIFNFDTKTWTRGPSLIASRFGHACEGSRIKNNMVSLKKTVDDPPLGS